MNLNKHWQPFVYKIFLHYQDELMNKDSNTFANQTEAVGGLVQQTLLMESKYWKPFTHKTDLSLFF